MDTATWQALGLVLTLLGLGTSAFVWTRRGPARGLRAAAWSLLPLAAALTGTLRLAGDVVGAVSRWATRLVFDPVTWSGIILAGFAVALFGLSGWMLRRGGAEAGPRRRRAGPGAARSAVTADQSTRPAQTPAGSASAPASGPASGQQSGGDPELAEIEALLRRRGIT